MAVAHLDVSREVIAVSKEKEPTTVAIPYSSSESTGRGSLSGAPAFLSYTPLAESLQLLNLRRESIAPRFYLKKGAA